MPAAAPMRTLAGAPIPKPLLAETEPCGPGAGPLQPSSGYRLQELGHGRNSRSLGSYLCVWIPPILPHPTTRDSEAPSRYAEAGQGAWRCATLGTVSKLKLFPDLDSSAILFPGCTA